MNCIFNQFKQSKGERDGINNNLMLKLEMRCACEDKSACEATLRTFVHYFAKMEPEEFWNATSLDKFKFSLCYFPPQLAAEQIMLLLGRFEAQFKNIPSKDQAIGKQFETCSPLVWDCLLILFYRLDHSQQKSFLKQLSQAFKETYSRLRQLVSSLQEQQSIYHGPTSRESHAMRLDQVLKEFQAFEVKLNFKRILNEQPKFLEQYAHFSNSFRIQGMESVGLFMLGACQFIFKVRGSQSFIRADQKDTMTRALLVLEELLSPIKGHEQQYLKTIGIALNKSYTALERYPLQHLEVLNSYSFLESKLKSLQINQDQADRLSNSLCRIATRFQQGSRFIQRDFVDMLRTSLRCLNNALNLQLHDSQNDQLYIRYYSLLQHWREKSTMFNPNSKQLPLYIRGLQAIFERKQTISSRFSYTLFTKFFSMPFLSTARKYIHIQLQTILKETRLFEIKPIMIAMQQNLGEQFFKKRQVSPQSGGSHSDSSDNQMMARTSKIFSYDRKSMEKIEAKEPKKLLKQYYLKFIHKACGKRATRKPQWKKTQNYCDLQGLFRKKGEYISDNNFDHQKILQELENSLDNLDLMMAIIKRGLIDQQKLTNLIIFLLFPEIGFELQKRGIKPINILRDIVEYSESQTVIIGGSGLEIHFSYQLAFIQTVMRYCQPDTDDFLMKYIKYFQKNYHLPFEDARKFYIRQAEQFFKYEASFLELLHTRCFNGIVPQASAFFYSNYAFASVMELQSLFLTSQVQQFYSSITELYPHPSMLDSFWKLYWLLFPLFGKHQLLNHLVSSSQYILEQVWQQIFGQTTRYQWRAEGELSRKRTSSKKSTQKQNIYVPNKAKSMNHKASSKKRKTGGRQTQITSLFPIKQQKQEPKIQESGEDILSQVSSQKNLREKIQIPRLLKNYLKFVQDLIVYLWNIKENGNNVLSITGQFWKKVPKYCWFCDKILNTDKFYQFNQVFIYCSQCNIENIQLISLQKPSDKKHKGKLLNHIEKIPLKYIKPFEVHWSHEQRNKLKSLVQELWSRLLGQILSQLKSKSDKFKNNQKYPCPVLSQSNDILLLQNIFNSVLKFSKHILASNFCSAQFLVQVEQQFNEIQEACQDLSAFFKETEKLVRACSVLIKQKHCNLQSVFTEKDRMLLQEEGNGEEEEGAAGILMD